MAADDSQSGATRDTPLFIKVVFGIAVSISAIAVAGVINMYGTLSALQERVIHRGFAIEANRDGLRDVVSDLKAGTDDRYRRRDAERDMEWVRESIEVHDLRLDQLERECLPALRRPYPGTSETPHP